LLIKNLDLNPDYQRAWIRIRQHTDHNWFQAGLWIRIDLMRIRIQHFLLIADPDPDADPVPVPDADPDPIPDADPDQDPDRGF
jgi:hypothetical protein